MSQETGKEHSKAASGGSTSQVPTVNLPKGGGAIRGIGEKFGTNPVNGTATMSVPIAVTPGRSGFGPSLSLSYDSGAGNGPFGFGWALSLPRITRKTEKGLPLYRDAEESDTFLLSDAEDLVPALESGQPVRSSRVLDGIEYSVFAYRPRIETLFARIERWVRRATGETHWRTITLNNITTFYGKTSASRIADPADPTHVFTWLICESYDDCGNAVVYEYMAENSARVDHGMAHEWNRSEMSRSANRYLKRVKYGNRVSRLVNPDLQAAKWLYELVFDYGEHDSQNPKPEIVSEWASRPDPFSSYRAGFEVRTYRLCQRALMFHRFPEELGEDATLVRSTDFNYSYEASPADEQNAIFSFLNSVEQAGYKRVGNALLRSALPPLEFGYSKARIADSTGEVDAASDENLPAGFDNLSQWVDLDGDGVAGILTEAGEGWFLKQNLSPVAAPGSVRLGPMMATATRPTSRESSQFVDLEGDGQLDLVTFTGSASGFYERTTDEDWMPHRTFAANAVLDWQESNAQLTDLTGDGRADLLLQDENGLAWYLSLGESGFDASVRSWQPSDEDKGPHLLSNDPTQAVYLADLSGDGLADVVRIRNGEVCYWPNLGYGRFGAKVTMDNAPQFDAPDLFLASRIRLADIDGSGVTDIIYLGRDGIRLYFNQSGNSWSNGRLLDSLPVTTDSSDIAVTDLFGNGTACLIWSSPLPADSGCPIRYVDLMGGNKPHLLIRVDNNLGAETRVHYASSTKFCLADDLAGKPWITRVPFPVHVVERIDTIDHLGRTRFVKRFAYHHGHFDGVEREFRGFGMVEQWDTEEIAVLAATSDLPDAVNIDSASYVPPVFTKTWFHTGVYAGRDRVANFFAAEYYREPGLTNAQANSLLLEDTILPDGLNAEEEREACRALRGSMLRQEIYALDGTSKEADPYSVTEQNFTVRSLQPIGGNRYGVFFTHPREAITYNYERNPADPRITHTLTLEVDDFGNVLRSVSIGYGRRAPDASLPLQDRDKQTRTLATYSETIVTNAVLMPDAHRSPAIAEVRTYELTGFLPKQDTTRFSFEDFANVREAAPVAYEQTAAEGVQSKRLIECARTLYRSDDLTRSLPLGVLESRAVSLESYTLAFTPGLVSSVYGSRLPATVVLSGQGADQGGYIDLDNNGHWWIPSGRVAFSVDGNDWEDARVHFFAPRKYTDAFGQSSFVDNDSHDLVVTRTRDALGNTAEVRNDYRVMQPSLVTDANGNRTAVVFDTLGLVAGVAVMGKESESVGDTLDGFPTDLSATSINAFLADPQGTAQQLLAGATTRFMYDVHRFQRDRLPPFAAALARETHLSDAAFTNIQIGFVYSDGFGREIQRKAQTEDSRWIGSGWTIFNNKGTPVKQYEPFFTASHDFEFARTQGVSPTMLYDPLGRQVATLAPDHSWAKTTFHPWSQVIWDGNDTALLDPRTDPDVGTLFRRLRDAEYLPTWHETHANAAEPQARDSAQKTAAHANTPSRAYFDTLGRTFLTVANNGVEGEYVSRTELDIEGNPRVMIDARNRVVMRYQYNLLGSLIHQASMDAGERWLLNDAAGNPIRAWDSRRHVFRSEYDELRRGVRSFARLGDREILFGRTVYGDGNETGLSASETVARNLRGRPVRILDTAGEIENQRFDFKGNLLEKRRRLTVDYQGTPDWSSAPAMSEEGFSFQASFDALNRLTSTTSPDGTVVHPTYNASNLLERIEAHLHGSADATTFVRDIDYDAKGQRQSIEYGNGVRTQYEYDPATFKLTRLLTLRGAEALQDLRYTYDPSGNITQLQDRAVQPIFFRNTVVEANSDLTYDAIYRLIRATGREHVGQLSAPQTTWDDKFRTSLLHPEDGQAMRRYVERYEYDEIGNFLRFIHEADGGNWTRTYQYGEVSLLEPSKVNDRLSGTTVGFDAETYHYNAHGSMLGMPHLVAMNWDFQERLQSVDLGGGGLAHYVYDVGGQRIRKVLVRQNGTRKAERLYLEEYEVYREFDAAGTTVVLERLTNSIADSARRIALVESRTVGVDGSPSVTKRYQFANHLGSTALEVDEQANVISYEEYHPYGTTSFQAGRNEQEVGRKLYRHTGKERDEESGFVYFGARYYAPWLGRWTCCDPKLPLPGGLFLYCQNSPIVFFDPDGRDHYRPQDATVMTEREAIAAYVPELDLPPSIHDLQFEKKYTEYRDTQKRGNEKRRANEQQEAAQAEEDAAMNSVPECYDGDTVRNVGMEQDPRCTRLKREVLTAIALPARVSGFLAIASAANEDELAPGVAAFVVTGGARGPKSVGPAKKPAERLGGPTIQKKDSQLTFMAVPGRKTTKATAEQAKQFQLSVKAKVERLRIVDKNGKVSNFVGDATSVGPSWEPDKAWDLQALVNSTEHTHPTSKIAQFSEQDILYFRNGNFPDDATHVVLGDKWPTARRVLSSEGVEGPPMDVVQTTIKQSDLKAVPSLEAIKQRIDFW